MISLTFLLTLLGSFLYCSKVKLSPSCLSPLSELAVIDLVQPGCGAGWEFRVSATASGRQVRVGAVRSGRHHAVPPLAHHGHSGIGVHQAGDEGLLPGQRLKGSRRLRQAVWTAGTDVMVLILRGQYGSVIQGERSVSPALTAQSWGTLTEAAVEAVRVTQLRHGRLVCIKRVTERRIFSFFLCTCVLFI